MRIQDCIRAFLAASFTESIVQVRNVPSKPWINISPTVVPMRISNMVTVIQLDWKVLLLMTSAPQDAFDRVTKWDICDWASFLFISHKTVGDGLVFRVGGKFRVDIANSVGEVGRRRITVRHFEFCMVCERLNRFQANGGVCVNCDPVFEKRPQDGVPCVRCATQSF